MRRLLKTRATWVGIGLILLSLIIWFGGELLQVGPFRPLGSDFAKAVVIVLIFVIWIGLALAKVVRAGGLMERLAPRATPAPKASHQAAMLQGRFADAFTRLGGKQRDGHSLYELPWYVIIGAPGSGKTTALENSGLTYSRPETGAGGGRAAITPVRGSMGTRNCEWWFSDDAVLLDTAGRYFSQDSDPDADSAEWSEFLRLLGTYRSRRPLNGVILAVSVDALLTADAADRERHVVQARLRLEELNRQLGIQLPVYVMVTKADLIAGFSEFFGRLSAPARAQVWGVTFPYDRTVDGSAIAALPVEVDALVTGLTASAYAQVDDDATPANAAAILAFPQQVAGLRDPLAEFLNDVFSATRFDRKVLLRGVYFTSGTQHGMPLDRVLGAMAAALGLPSGAVPPRGPGKAFFLQRTLKDVLIAESGLAGTNWVRELRKGMLQLGLYAVLGLLAVVGVLLLWRSHSQNQAYLAEVARDVDLNLRSMPPLVDSSLARVLPRLATLKAVTDSAERHRDHVPLAMRWGLYQGGSVGTAASDAYLRELERLLVPWVVRSVEERMQAPDVDTGDLYDHLKAYLMMGGADHFDPAYVGALLANDFSRTESPETAAALSGHLREWLASGPPRTRRLNGDLIAQTQSTLRQKEMEGLVYARLRAQYRLDRSRQLRLDTAMGLNAATTMRWRNGRRLDDPIDGFFTQPVFREVAGRSASQLVDGFRADAWVWGPGGLPPLDAPTLGAKVLRRYEDEYIRVWQDVLNGMEPVRPADRVAGANALTILGGEASPFRGWLQTIDRHTHLVDEAAPAVPGLLDRARSAAEQTIGVPPATRTASGYVAGTRITDAFKDVHDLLAGQPGQTRVDQLLKQFSDVAAQMKSAGNDVLGGTSNLADPARGGAAAQALKERAEGLPPPVRTFVEQVSGRTGEIALAGVRTELDGLYQQRIARLCAEVVTNRYPFDRTSSIDAPLDNVAELFGPSGAFAGFYKEHLAQLVNDTVTPWQWRRDAAGAAVGGSTAMLRQFEAAQRIQDMLFARGGQGPQFAVTAEPLEMSAETVRFQLEVDGQRLVYRNDPVRGWRIQWPGPTPGDAAITLEAPNGRNANRVFRGPWAWLRLLDTAEVQPEKNDHVTYRMTFRLAPQYITLRVEAASVRNPIATTELSRFRCQLRSDLP